MEANESKEAALRRAWAQASELQRDAVTDWSHYGGVVGDLGNAVRAFCESEPQRPESPSMSPSESALRLAYSKASLDDREAIRTFGASPFGFTPMGRALHAFFDGNQDAMAPQPDALVRELVEAVNAGSEPYIADERIARALSALVAREKGRAQGKTSSIDEISLDLAEAVRKDRDRMLAAFERLVPRDELDRDGTLENKERWLRERITQSAHDAETVRLARALGDCIEANPVPTHEWHQAGRDALANLYSHLKNTPSATAWSASHEEIVAAGRATPDGVDEPCSLARAGAGDAHAGAERPLSPSTAHLRIADYGRELSHAGAEQVPVVFDGFPPTMKPLDVAPSRLTPAGEIGLRVAADGGYGIRLTGEQARALLAEIDALRAELERVKGGRDAETKLYEGAVTSLAAANLKLDRVGRDNDTYRTEVAQLKAELAAEAERAEEASNANLRLLKSYQKHLDTYRAYFDARQAFEASDSYDPAKLDAIHSAERRVLDLRAKGGA